MKTRVEPSTTSANCGRLLALHVALFPMHAEVLELHSRQSEWGKSTKAR